MDPLLNGDLIPTKDAAKLSGYTSDYLARLARSGKIIGRKIGNSWLVDKESLAHFLQEQSDRKIDYIRELARTREAEYRARHVCTHTRESVSIHELHISGFDIEKSSPRSRFSALSIATAVLMFAALTAQAGIIPRLGDKTASLAREISSGLQTALGDSPVNSAPRIVSPSFAEMRHPYPSAPPSSFFENIPTHSYTTLVSIPIVPSVTSASGRETFRESISGLYVLFTTPSLVVGALDDAFVAFGTTIIDATHLAIHADVAFAYGIAQFAPESARATVSFIGGVGDTLAGATTRVPTLAVAVYLRAISLPATLAPDIASAIFSAEYAAATHFVAFTNVLAARYVELISNTGNLVYESATATLALKDAYLGALGRDTLTLDSSFGAALTPAGHTSLLAAALPALSAGEQAALFTYQMINGVFDSATGALASLFGSTSNIAVVSNPPQTVLPFGTSTTPAVTPQLTPPPAPPPAPSLVPPPPPMPAPVPPPRIASVTNTYPTYTTVVNGASEDFVNQSLATLRGNILATVAGMVQPVAAQTATNVTSIQQVNMIQDLSNLIVRNGDFRGGTFDSGNVTNGISVSAATGNFTNLTGGATTLATTSITGALTVNGVAVTGGGGSTSSTAGYFTATSTTASTFPYASTTALTVSGANGLFLASLNGPLQANNGIVSATTSLGVLYGGTGLTSMPAYGNILVGNASGGYTLTATSSLGIQSSLSFTYPLVNTSNTISTAFGTTTSNTWGGTQTFTTSPVLSTLGAGAVAATAGGSLYNTATTSVTSGSGISFTGSAGALIGGSNLTITNTGVLSLAQTYGSAQTGALTFASSTSGTDFSITNSSGAFTFNLPTASATARGLLTNTDWNTFNSKQAAISATWPITLTGATLGWNGLSTSTAAVVGNIPYFSGANTFANVATTSATLGSEFSYSGTFGSLVGGASGSLSLATNGTPLTKIAQIAANSILGNATGATGNVTAIATSSLNIGGTAGNVTGIVAVANGGTGTSTWLTGSIPFYNGTQLTENNKNLYWDNVNNRLGIGTTSPYSTLSVVGETVSSYFTATSTTATSTFANNISIGSGKDYRINGSPALSFSGNGVNSNIIIGQLNTNTSVAGSSSAIGYNNTVSGTVGNTAIGISNTVSPAVNGTAIGANNTVSGGGSVAVGYGNIVSVGSSAAFGMGITNAIASSLQIGPSDAAKLTILGAAGSIGYVGIGTTSPYSMLSVAGQGVFQNIVATGTQASTFAGNVGVGTTTPGSLLSIQGIANFTTATSTFYGNGLNLTSGCFAINSVCTGNGSVTSVSGSGGTTGLTLTGGPITTSGTLTLGGTLAVANGGTGTSTWLTGSVPFYNGTNFTENNSNLFWDNTNKRLGIGTASPSYTLDVAGNINASTQFFGKAGINLTANPSYSFSGFPNYGSYLDTNSGFLQFVGSGTKLGGFYKAATQGFGFNNNSVLSWNSAGEGSPDVMFSRYAANTLSLDSSSAGNHQGILLAGTIGIGTTSPYSMLSVAGQVVGQNFVATSTTLSDFVGSDGSASIPTYSFASEPKLGLYRDSANSLSISSGGGTPFSFKNKTITELLMNATTTVGQVNFSFAQNGTQAWTTYVAGANSSYRIYSYLKPGGAADVFDIAYNGNVGIGTTSPYSMLSVAGQVVAQNFVATSTTAVSTFAGSVNFPNNTVIQTNGDIVATRYRDAYASAFILDSSGSDGLRLASTLPVGWSSNAGVTNTDTGLSRLAANTIGIGNGTVGNSSGTLIAGNVGIGTSSPYSMLSVAGQVVGQNFVATSTTATSTISSGGFDVNTGNLVVQGATGRVGVGIENPGVALDVNGTMRTNSSLYSANEYTLSLNTNGNANLPITASGANDIIFKPNSIEAMRIKNGGNVGIGTTSPGSLLSLGNTGANTINISATATSTFGSGINVLTGCFAVNGVCVGVGSGAVSSVSNSDGTLTISPTTGAVVSSLNLSHANTWTALQTFNASANVAAGQAYQYNGTSVITASTTLNNYFFGGAGNLTMTGGDNTGTGPSDFSSNTTGSSNTAYGEWALFSNVSGSGNSASGFKTLGNNNDGSQNIANGEYALYSNVSGSYNVANGTYALYNTTGSFNTALGQAALYRNTSGSNSAAVGANAFYNNTSATGNSTALGFSAAYGNGAGYSNQGGTYAGYQSGYSADTGSDFNTFLGYQSGYGVTTGSNNIWLGTATSSTAIANLTTGSQNILIGNNISLPSATASGQLNIGNLIYGTGITGTGSTLSSGNIGIGTTTPSATLAVNGLMYVGGTGTSTVQNNLYVMGTLRATNSYVGDLIFKNNFRFAEGDLSAPIQTLNLKNQFGSTTVTFEDTGSVGIATTTPSAKLTVSGNVFATSYEASPAIATGYTLGAMGSTTSPQAMTTADIPEAVLTANGNVDLYKLATYNLSGVQALAAKLDAQNIRLTSLETRVAALESGAVSSASGSPVSFSASSLASALQRFGVTVSKDFSHIVNIVTDNLAVGSSSHPTGITMYDKVTSAPYCFAISNGVPTTTPGPCASTADASSAPTTSSGTSCTLSASPTSVTPGDHVVLSWSFPDAGTFSIDQNIGSVSPALSGTTTSKAIDADTTFTGTGVSSVGGVVTTCIATVSVTSMPPPVITSPSPSPTTSSTTTTTNTASTADTMPPVVTLVGDAAMQITVGDSFTDPGATALDDVDGDLTAKIKETGAVDTATAGLYTLTYSATDAAGNIDSVSRVVTVVAAPVAPPTSTASTTATVSSTIPAS
ncbi:MAG: immunoglobulin-like domain-containing protein [Minisyncoccota bacterium]